MKKRITMTKEMAEEIILSYDYLDEDMGRTGVGTKENTAFLLRLKKTFGIQGKYFFDKKEEATQI